MQNITEPRKIAKHNIKTTKSNINHSSKTMRPDKHAGLAWVVGGPSKVQPVVK